MSTAALQKKYCLNVHKDANNSRPLCVGGSSTTSLYSCLRYNLCYDFDNHRSLSAPLIDLFLQTKPLMSDCNDSRPAQRERGSDLKRRQTPVLSVTTVLTRFISSKTLFHQQFPHADTTWQIQKYEVNLNRWPLTVKHSNSIWLMGGKPQTAPFSFLWVRNSSESLLQLRHSNPSLIVCFCVSCAYYKTFKRKTVYIYVTCLMVRADRSY